MLSVQFTKAQVINPNHKDNKDIPAPADHPLYLPVVVQEQLLVEASQTQSMISFLSPHTTYY